MLDKSYVARNKSTLLVTGTVSYALFNSYEPFACEKFEPQPPSTTPIVI